MKFVMDRAALLKSLGHVQSVVERRGTVPILSNVKIDARGSQIQLTATDMDIAVSEMAPATVQTPGSATVPAHTFYEIARKLPEGAQVEISLTKEAAKAVIRAGASRFSLSTLPVEDFPVMAEGDLGHKFVLSAAQCNALIEKSRFAVAADETRYYLNGIYFHAVESGGTQVLRAVATDGHRLARIEVPLPPGAAGMPGVIIPRKTLGEIKKLVDEGGPEVEISLSDSKIRFVCGNATLVSKLIDATYPDYERVIPAGNDKIMEVECKAFTQGVDRVSVIASDKTRGIRLALAPGKLTLSADSPEYGNATEEIDVQYSADSFEIGFNSRYVLEMMQHIVGETVQFVYGEPAAPAFVRDTGDIGAIYVIMPMRV